MSIVDWLDETEIIKQLNKMSFDEILTMLKSEISHGGHVKELPEGVIEVYTAGWSENEYLLGLIQSPLCTHKYQWIGSTWACQYFQKNKNKLHHYYYTVTATKKR